MSGMFEWLLLAIFLALSGAGWHEFGRRRGWWTDSLQHLKDWNPSLGSRRDRRTIYVAFGVLVLGIVTGLTAALFKGWYYP